MSSEFSFEITDANCIIHAAFGIKPGANVLIGDHGVGKSTTLVAIADALAGNKPNVSVRDGAEKAIIRGPGVMVTIGKKTTRDGTSDMDAADSQAIAKFIDPGVKDPDSANASRIKELVRLRGVEISNAEFKQYLAKNGIIDPALLVEIAGVSDPVVAVGKLKRALDSKARVYEKDSDTLQGELNILMDQAGVISEPLDVEKTKEELQAAIRAKDALEQRVTAAADSAQKIEQAQEQLKGVMSEAGEEGLDALLVSQCAEITRIANQLGELEKMLEIAESHAKETERSVKNRDKNRERAAELRKVMEATAIKAPTEAELNEAANAVTLASRRNTEAQNQVIMQERIEEIDAKTKSLAALKERANKFRSTGKSIEGILVERIGSTRFQITNGELIWNGDDSRPAEAFARLSDGLRSRIALEEVLDVYSEKERPPIVILPQTFWESLNTPTRNALAIQAREANACLLSARNDTGPLRLEYFDGTE